jgi:hypothetical protein
MEMPVRIRHDTEEPAMEKSRTIINISDLPEVARTELFGGLSNYLSGFSMKQTIAGRFTDINHLVH